MKKKITINRNISTKNILYCIKIERDNNPESLLSTSKTKIKNVNLKKVSIFKNFLLSKYFSKRKIKTPNPKNNEIERTDSTYGFS